jgi:putative transposase
MMGKKKYLSDLSDLEWEQIKHLFVVDYRRGGRPPKYERRHILNAIFYIARTECQWYFLPKDFPPWQLVYAYFRK